MTRCAKSGWAVTGHSEVNSGCVKRATKFVSDEDLAPAQVRRLRAVAAVAKLFQVLLNFPSSRPFSADVHLPGVGLGFFYT